MGRRGLGTSGQVIALPYLMLRHLIFLPLESPTPKSPSHPRPLQSQGSPEP